jgi:hypothetical protein
VDDAPAAAPVHVEQPSGDPHGYLVPGALAKDGGAAAAREQMVVKGSVGHVLIDQ